MAVRRELALVLGALLAAACQAPRVCEDSRQCAPGAVCVEQICVPMPDAGPVDGGASSLDAGYPCVLNNGGCDFNATCSAIGGIVTCQCNPGYTGDGQVCAPIDAGSSPPDGGVPDGGVPDGGVPDGGVPDGGLHCGLDPSCSARTPVPGGPNNRPLKSCAVACPAGLICAPAGECVTPSYSVSDAGIVTEEATGLQWAQVPQIGCWGDSQGCTPPEAASYCASLNLGGHGGWVAPSIQQLFSLVEVQPGNPFAAPINPVLSLTDAQNGANNVEMSATRSPPSGDWAVDFETGRVLGRRNKTSIRCVLEDPDAGPVDAGYFDFCGTDDADGGTPSTTARCTSDQDCTAAPPSTAACLQGRCVTTLFTSADSPMQLIPEGSNLYVREHVPNPGSNPSPPGVIVRVPVAGGSPVTVASIVPEPVTFSVDAQNLYWSLPFPGPAVVTQPVAGGTPVTLAKQVRGGDPFFHVGPWLYWDAWSTFGLNTCGGAVQTVLNGAAAVAVNSSGVYWFQGSDLMRQPLAGGAPATVATDVVPLPDSFVAADDTHLYWVSGDAWIYGLPLNGGTPTMLTDKTGEVRAFAIDSTGAYFVGYNTNGWTLGRVPLSGGTVETLYSQPGSAGTLGVGLAVDDTSVYFVSFPPGFENSPGVQANGSVLAVTPK